jgi:hypothetical protein
LRRDAHRRVVYAARSERMGYMDGEPRGTRDGVRLVGT